MVTNKSFLNPVRRERAVQDLYGHADFEAAGPERDAGDDHQAGWLAGGPGGGLEGREELQVVGAVEQGCAGRIYCLGYLEYW